MATILEAVAAEILYVFELPDTEPRLPIRPLYAAEEFYAWGDDTWALHDKGLAMGGRTLFEHMLQTLCDFRCSERSHQVGELRRMMPVKEGVWSLHSTGVRIYGWCPFAESFVAVTGGIESDTKKDPSLNDKKRDEVLSFARRNGLSGTIKLGDILALFPHKV